MEIDIMELVNDEIGLVLKKDSNANPAKNWLRNLEFNIILKSKEISIGHINLRIGYTDSIVFYGGHIGYCITEEYRGNHYAGKACLLLKNEIKNHGLDVIWITCNPDNHASRKTCEWIGAEYVTTVDLPEDNDQYLEGERQKCRYRWIIF
jgi:predicted acetyltransferase